jgi:hypothetical protein
VTATQLPEPLAALATTLEARGFAVDEQPPSKSFGDQLITFADERLRVRLTRDRSIWTIELGHPAWDRVYDPDLWRAALEGADPTMEPSDLEEQAVYVIGALDTLREAASDPALDERLGEIAVARANFWFR